MHAREHLVIACPSCRAVHDVDRATLVFSDAAWQCKKCGWKGKDYRIHKPEHGFDGPEEDVELDTGQKVKAVTSDGTEVEKDFEDQHVEAPVGGLLMLLQRSKRDQYCGSLICYLLFVINVVVLIVLYRPVNHIFEVQDAIAQDVLTAPFPPIGEDPQGSNIKKTREDAETWEDFWVFLRMFGKKVYNGQETKPVYSWYTIGKYNRILTAIRLRQARVDASLPFCDGLRTADGSLPDEYDVACSVENLANTNSCTTLIESHDISRPCWGAWDPAFQAEAYPSPIQKETAVKTRDPDNPQHELECRGNCAQYFVHGKRSCLDLFAFCRPEVLAWVSSFYIANFTLKYEVLMEEGFARCEAACDVSDSNFTGNLAPPRVALASLFVARRLLVRMDRS
jgi:hypothetical protein